MLLMGLSDPVSARFWRRQGRFWSSSLAGTAEFAYAELGTWQGTEDIPCGFKQDTSNPPTGDSDQAWEVAFCSTAAAGALRAREQGVEVTFNMPTCLMLCSWSACRVPEPGTHESGGCGSVTFGI